jgi:hypothetical protein
LGGLRDAANDRADRFLGKVSEDTARCRGGEAAIVWRSAPWVDWPQYWSAGEEQSRFAGWTAPIDFLSPNRRGINGALLDIEHQRIELLKFNLFDNSSAYPEYVTGNLARQWAQQRLPKEHRCSPPSAPTARKNAPATRFVFAVRPMSHNRRRTSKTCFQAKRSSAATNYPVRFKRSS